MSQTLHLMLSLIAGTLQSLEGGYYIMILMIMKYYQDRHREDCHNEIARFGFAPHMTARDISPVIKININ